MANITHLIADHIPKLEPPEVQLRSAMINAGLAPPDSFQFDGQLHRYDDQKECGDALWYVAFDSAIPGGCFGSFRTGDHINWRGQTGRTYSMVEEMAFKSAIEEARRKAAIEKQIKQELAADDSAKIWDGLTLATEQHPYLVRKGVHPHMARVDGQGALVVPMADLDGNIMSLQTIFANGKKLFHKGGKVDGALLQFGSVGPRVYIGEGFATCATIYEETGTWTVAAFSASNLVPVAKELRSTDVSLEIIIVADNDNFDEHQKIYPGKHWADKAASLTGAVVIMSPGTPGSGDVNDYRQHGGDVKGLLVPQNDLFDKLKVITANDLPEEYEAPDEVIEGLIVAKTQTVLYGDSNSGKTFFALSLGYAVSENLPCYDRRTDGGLVVYLATEAPGSIRARVQALKKFHGSSMSHFIIVQAPLNFYSNAGDASDLIRLVDQVEISQGKSVRLIIADTLARMSSGANENSGEDMGPVMERFSIVAEHTGAALVIIHHNGKDAAKGARGWSGIRAHIDTEIEVEEVDGVRFAKVTKQRELSSKGDEIAFELQVVKMGFSKFGGDVTTCVAVPSSGEKKPKVDKATRERHRILNAAFEYSGMDQLDGFPYITRSSLVQYLIEKEGKSPESAKKAATEGSDRFIGFLVSAGTVQSKGNGWIVVDPAMSSAMSILSSNNAKNTHVKNN